MQSLSDALLADEAACRASMEALFLQAALRARPRLKASAAAGPAAMIAQSLETEFTDELALVTVGCLGHAQTLWTAGVGKALTTVKVELEHIEWNLGRRYDGLASSAVDSARAAFDTSMADLRATWLNDAALALVQFEDKVVDDWRAAAQGDETPEQLDRRMFSADPVRLPGHGGMGSWWAPFQACYAAAKAEEFIAVNGVRRDAIATFNRDGIRLRDGG